MQLNFGPESHPTDDAFEEYAFGRLTEEKVAAVEEHLLVCEKCQTTLEEVERYMQLMKAGTATFRPSPKPAPGRVQNWIRSHLPHPRTLGARTMVWGAALATACVAILFSIRTPPATGAASVMLASVRGDATTMAHAPAGAPLHLTIKAVDVPAAAEYRLEIVTASGKPMWQSAPELSGEYLVAQVPQGLKAGLYWVRIYDAHIDPRAEPLLEFGLRVL